MGAKLFFNGDVWTLDDQDRSGTCLLVEDGRIQGVFDSPDGRTERAGLELIDLEGRTVIPGFNDNHLHMHFWGDSLDALHLAGMGEAEIVTRLRERFGGAKQGQLLLAYDWDYPACADPRKEPLDAAFPDNPVILAQYGGHNLWVNSLTLKKMGIGAKPNGGVDGIICRDADGSPTGLLKELNNNPYLDNWMIGRLLNFRQNRKNYEKAMELCAEQGITTAQDNTWSFVAMMAIRSLRRQGKLTLRLSCWPLGESPVFRHLFELQGFDEAWFHKGPVKYFIDGTFSGRTAWLKEPYAGTDDCCGFGKPKRELTPLLAREVARQRQCAFHAIGDRAVSEYLDAVEELAGRYDGIPALRLRLEHAQLVDPEDIERIKRLGILVCSQPSALCDPEKDRRLLGEARARRAYPYRSLLDAGVHLSFGSDAPGEASSNPFTGIHYAIHRDSDERITLMEALKCYTSGSAYAEFKEAEKGALSPGMAADFLVLSEKLRKADPDRIGQVRVARTYVDGELIYKSAG